MISRIILAAPLALCLVTPAFAHAHLKMANPAEGETVAAPKQISMEFSEKLESGLSGASVTDAAGHEVNSGPASVKDMGVTVPVPALKPGVYHVSWHAVSVDTHRTEGSYSFTVRP
jgi:copper resistance protein C